MPVRAKRMTSVDQVRGVIARGSGGGALTRIKDKQTLRFRFLGEPDTWLEYQEHYDKVWNFYPCADDGTCPGCADNVKTSKKFLVNIVELSEKTVVALVLTFGVAEELLLKYDKNSTLMDRVYEISRTGGGIKDTRYIVNHDDAKRADLSRFEPLDLEALINTQLPSSDDVVDVDADADDDLEEATPATKAIVRNIAKKAAPAVRRGDDLDDDEFAPARPARTVQVAKAIKKVAPPVARPPVTAGGPQKKILRRPGA